MLSSRSGTQPTGLVAVPSRARTAALFATSAGVSMAGSSAVPGTKPGVVGMAWRSSTPNPGTASTPSPLVGVLIQVFLLWRGILRGIGWPTQPLPTLLVAAV